MFYLDHGWIDEIFFDEVRLLRTEMAKLLPQAIRGCLDNVRPAMGLWTRWATMTFRKAVSQVKIYAKVTGVDSKVCIDTIGFSSFVVRNMEISGNYRRRHSI